MPLNPLYIASFTSQAFYHITARAVGNQLLFLSDEFRAYFVYRFKTMLNGYITTLAYTLIDNHIHWMIRVNAPETLIAHLNQLHPVHLKEHQRKYLSGALDIDTALELQFKDLFISYAMYFNKQFKRKGSLFIKPFRRVAIENQAHYTQLVGYIHCNRIKHLGIVDYQNYPWSSYHEIISDKPGFVDREEVLNWFGGKRAFEDYHEEQAKYYIEKWRMAHANDLPRSQLAELASR
jgi:REP element-mobilizing transposase RayT